MAVFWEGTMADGTTPNRFKAKHLHLVDSSYTLEKMKQEGKRILQERNSFVQVPNKKAKYGKIKPSANTLIVTNQGGFEEMNAWVQQNANSSGHFTIPVKIGVVVSNHYESGPEGSNFFFDDAKVGGSFKASIEVSGTDKRVYHMDGIDEQGIELQDFKMNRGGVAFTV